MHNHLIPLLLVALPILYLGHRLGWLERRWVRWALGGALVPAAAFAWPWGGVDYLYVKRINLLLAAVAALLMLLRHYRVPWTRKPARLDAALAALAALAAVNYVNFFSFHGERTFVHLHDVAHYYLGSKYYGELGYTDLYTAMLRAEAEVHDDHFKAIEARDLETYERVHIRALLERSGPVKAAFTPERWAEFQRDVDVFRQDLDRQYGTVLLDHGFNPTPVWALLGGSLSRLVPGGSRTGILWLTLLDPLILAALFAVVGRTFGRRLLLLAILYFCVVFGATFGWTGGAFLRYPWFFGVVAGLCCLHRRRYGAAGALLAAAALLRVFPAFFLLPLACKAAALAWRRRALPRRYLTLFAAFAATVVFGALLTGLLPRGLGHWGEFRANMSNHLENISPNVVGLTEALTFRPGGGEVTAEEFATLKVRRQRIHRVQLALVFLPLLLLVARLAPRRTDMGAALLALPLLYAGLSLAAYYYVFLLALLFAERARPGRLALILGVEAACYALMLFENREGVLYVYRGLLLASLYLALNLDSLRRLWPRRGLILEE